MFCYVDNTRSLKLEDDALPHAMSLATPLSVHLLCFFNDFYFDKLNEFKSSEYN
jgi:hypothetical protein